MSWLTADHCSWLARPGVWAWPPCWGCCQVAVGEHHLVLLEAAPRCTVGRAWRLDSKHDDLKLCVSVATQHVSSLHHRRINPPGSPNSFGPLKSSRWRVAKQSSVEEMTKTSSCLKPNVTSHFLIAPDTCSPSPSPTPSFPLAFRVKAFQMFWPWMYFFLFSSPVYENVVPLSLLFWKHSPHFTRWLNHACWFSETVLQHIDSTVYLWAVRRSERLSSDWCRFKVRRHTYTSRNKNVNTHTGR